MSGRTACRVPKRHHRRCPGRRLRRRTSWQGGHWWGELQIGLGQPVIVQISRLLPGDWAKGVRPFPVEPAEPFQSHKSAVARGRRKGLKKPVRVDELIMSPHVATICRPRRTRWLSEKRSGMVLT
jgi:hypothetical protein